MKAVILAGGMGTRGRPYTDYFPKAMMPACGRPLIHHIVQYLKSYRFVDEIIIVSDYGGLGGQIRNYLGEQKRVSYVQDSQSGTGGDLLHISGRLDSEFVLWFADNLCAVDLAAMRRHFGAKGGDACIATRRMRREETGFAIVRDGMVSEFREKPTVELPMSECLGIYILGRKVLDRIRAKRQKCVNLSYDVLQQLAGEGGVSAFDIGDAEWIDAESPVVLERNQKTVKKIIAQMES